MIKATSELKTTARSKAVNKKNDSILEENIRIETREQWNKTKSDWKTNSKMENYRKLGKRHLRENSTIIRKRQIMLKKNYPHN